MNHHQLRSFTHCSCIIMVRVARYTSWCSSYSASSETVPLKAASSAAPKEPSDWSVAADSKGMSESKPMSATAGTALSEHDVPGMRYQCQRNPEPGSAHHGVRHSSFSHRGRSPTLELVIPAGAAGDFPCYANNFTWWHDSTQWQFLTI